MIRVNGVCNAGCAFCELSGDRKLGAEGLEAAVEQLQRDHAQGAHRVIVGGGEPLLEPRLGALIDAARAAGYEEVVLESNGMVASRPETAKDLVDRGLTEVLWAVNGTDAATGDAIFGFDGAHAAALEGARAFVEAGARVIARTPLAAPLLKRLDALPAWLQGELPGIAGWVVRPLSRGPRARFEANLLPSLPDLGEALRAASQAARRVDLPFTIEDDVGLPLCLLRGQAASLRALARHPHRDRSATHTKMSPCADCAVGGECPGQPIAYAEAHGPFDVHPFDRMPNALVARASRPEQYVIYDRTSEQGTELTGPQVTIRVVMPCNQACHFCFVDRTSPGLKDDEIFAAIDAAAAEHAFRVSFSGGEPTLHKRLDEFIRRATARGISERELQTNALKLADPELAERLVSAGLTQAVVSLHAVDPERYLAITGAGHPDTTIAGIRNLLDRGIRIELNVVHNRDNLDHLEAIVATIAERIPEVHTLFSVTYIVEGLPREWQDVALRYSDAVPHLAAAMRLARERGLTYRMTGRCGTPPCVWRDHLSELFEFQLMSIEGEHANAGLQYLEGCERCPARPHCFGINPSYLRRFGPDEFAPLPAADWEAAAGV